MTDRADLRLHLPEHHHGRVRHHGPEDEVQPSGADPAREEGPAERPRRRRQLEDHGHAEVGEVVSDVGRGRPTRGRDDGDDRRADGVSDVDVQPEREGRNDDDAATETEEGAEEASEE